MSAIVDSGHHFAAAGGEFGAEPRPVTAPGHGQLCMKIDSMAISVGSPSP
jgi:hypothetical protein